MIISVNFDSPTLMMIFLASTICSITSFLIADLVLVNTYESACLALGFQGGAGVFSDFLLGEWIIRDSYVKLAFTGTIIYFSMFLMESKKKGEIIIACGNLMTLYWIFELGWSIVGSVLFWGWPQNLTTATKPTYQYCEGSPFYSYLFARLIIMYVLFFINIALSRARPKHLLLSESAEISITPRRDTELLEKSKWFVLPLYI